MAARPIGVGGLMALFNPRAVPLQVMQELGRLHGFSPKEAEGCMADIMISQRKNEFPPVAFVLVHKDSPANSVAKIMDKLGKVEKAFDNVFGVVVLPVPYHLELQLELAQAPIRTKLFTVPSMSSVVDLIASIHGKLSTDTSVRADRLYQRMHHDILSKQYATRFLQLNFPFLKLDECEMLLDLFGSIGAVARATAAEILDVTVLDSAAAQAIEDFFQAEYAVE